MSMERKNGVVKAGIGKVRIPVKKEGAVYW
jgi:hypothetical protein